VRHTPVEAQAFLIIAAKLRIAIQMCDPLRPSRGTPHFCDSRLGCHDVRKRRFGCDALMRVSEPLMEPTICERG